MKKLIFTLLCCLCMIGAKADEYQVSDLTYTDDNGTTWTYSIYEYGEMIEDGQRYEVYDRYSTIWTVTDYPNDVVVPNSFIYGGIEYPVKNMNSQMFFLSDITSIQLPNKLEAISSDMFAECNNLQTINIPESVTRIESSAFYGCSSLTSIVIPEGVTSIGESAFAKCDSWQFAGGEISPQKGLKSISLPSTLSHVGSYAFEGCSLLEEVHMSNGITNIGYSVFKGCSSLREITIPESVTTIGYEAFADCNSLNIELPVSVKTIDDRAFAGCTVSLNATDPAWLTMNANSTYFDGATIVVPDDAYAAYTTSPNWEKYVSNIYAASEMVQYPYTDDNDVTWTYRYVLSNSSVRIVKIEGYSTDIDAPATLPWKEQQLPVTAIECSFVGDENIVSVDLSKTSIITIPSFSGCSSLSTVLLPSTLESISESTFYYCSNLQSIDLSATKVKEIKNKAFYHCSNLSEITFPAALSTISDWAFSCCI